jgi:hypothetical protein
MQNYLIAFGMLLYLISLFLRVKDEYTGMVATLGLFIRLWRSSHLEIFLGRLFQNGSTIAMLAIIICLFLPLQRWFIIFPSIGFLSASWWWIGALGKQESYAVGYWIWYAGQSIVYLAFTLKVLEW